MLELSNLSLCDLLVYFESSPHFATVIPSRTNQSHPKAKEGIEDMCILHDHNSHTPKRAILHTLLSLCHLYMIDWLWLIKWLRSSFLSIYEALVKKKLKIYFLPHLASPIAYPPKGPKSPKPQDLIPFFCWLLTFLLFPHTNEDLPLFLFRFICMPRPLSHFWSIVYSFQFCFLPC